MAALFFGYIINAGGIIDAYYILEQKSLTAMWQHIAGIAETLTQLFELATQENITTYCVADRMAERRFRH